MFIEFFNLFKATLVTGQQTPGLPDTPTFPINIIITISRALSTRRTMSTRRRIISIHRQTLAIKDSPRAPTRLARTSLALICTRPRPLRSRTAVTSVLRPLTVSRSTTCPLSKARTTTAFSSRVCCTVRARTRPRTAMELCRSCEVKKEGKLEGKWLEKQFSLQFIKSSKLRN
jgi:hypothetical protein